MLRALTIAASIAVASPAFANDTMAELRTGGLVFVRTDAVTIESEDLYISPHEVRVAYRFRNFSEEDVESIVAFPMPDITFYPEEEIAMPEPGVDNFLGFSVNADGADIKPQLEQRAIAAGLDVTDEVLAAGLSVNPADNRASEEAGRLPEATRQDWVSRGMLRTFSYDDGSGWKTEYHPAWTMRSTYWWRMSFPAGRPIEVRHSYKPSVGGTSGISFFHDGKIQGAHYPAMKDKFCIDSGFERAVIAAAKRDPNGYPPYWENWISYVLTTGANWAYSIGEFTLTIDKGKASNLVSFCGSGVEKIGPTTFRVHYTDFVPERDIEILILNRFE